MWHAEEYTWDPIKMVAKPAESSMRGAKGKSSQTSETSDEAKLRPLCQVRPARAVGGRGLGAVGGEAGAGNRH